MVKLLRVCYVLSRPTCMTVQIQIQPVTQHMIRNNVFKTIVESYLLLVGKFIVLITLEPQSVHDHGIQANHQS